ncbi:DUF192 domain-containing protein [bacterium]|nr:DUF192 domain-containing protein [candidate division CSSED10-310 bacterium]
MTGAWRRRCRVVNERTGEILGNRVGIADNFITRGIGLLARDRLDEGEGLWIVPCGSVHTLCMRFAIDILYLDKQGRITRIVRELKPWRLSFGVRRSWSVLELPAGGAGDCVVGDRLKVSTVGGSEGMTAGGSE